VLRHDPRVDRRDHDVVRAIHYEGRLLDRPQFGKALALDLTPLEDRRVLSLRGLLRSRRIKLESALASLLPSRLLSRPVGVPGGLASLRRRNRSNRCSSSPRTGRPAISSTRGSVRGSCPRGAVPTSISRRTSCGWRSVKEIAV
jgi:hypothetical protein